MPNKFFLGSQRLLSDPDPLKVELGVALNDYDLYLLDLDVDFTGETIRTENQLYSKLESLIDGVSYRDIKVTRQGDAFISTAVVNKSNFLDLIRHANYGIFPGDYTLVIRDFLEYGADEEEVKVNSEHDDVLKPTPVENMVDGMDLELTVTIRRGREPTDRPARGMQTFNLMSDPAEVVKILKHFKIEKKITRVTKATPQRPTLQIRLTDPVSELFEEDEYLQPCLIYDPTPQSVASGASQLWAHLHASSEKASKRVVLEGIHGVVPLPEVEHRLNYHGELLSAPEPVLWTEDEEYLLSGIPNGNICVHMKLKFELNYLMIGRESFRVSYPDQPTACSVCFSWLHKASECSKRSMGRDKLREDYLWRWKRSMNFKERSASEVYPARPSSAAASSSSDSEESKEPNPNDNDTKKPEEAPTPTSTTKPAVSPKPTNLQVALPKTPTNPIPKVTRNLASEFDNSNVLPVLPLSTIEKVATSTPKNILENYAEVYEVQQKGNQDKSASGPELVANDANPEEVIRAEKEPVEKVEKALPTVKVKEPANNKKAKDLPATNNDSIGWSTVKPRKKRGAIKDSGASSSSSSDNDDADKKRKAESPKANEVKMSGSGRKKGFYAEHAKVRFFTEHNVKFDEKAMAEAKTSTVKKETLKRNLHELETSYYKLFFENPSGTDPHAKENWEEISRALNETKLRLEKKPSA